MPEKLFKSATFLQREVPRREAVLTIAREIEELNNANLGAAAEVARRYAAFHEDLQRCCVANRADRRPRCPGRRRPPHPRASF
jgi:hypothetical protein